MGIFANEPPIDQIKWLSGKPIGLGAQICPDHLNGYDAMGYIVPFYRQAEAYRHLKQMGFTDRHKILRLVSAMSASISRDEPHQAMEEAFSRGLDVTGCYRLMAVLLCAERPE